MISIGGYRPLQASASLGPSIEPGMPTSVNTTWISERAFMIRKASAFDASMASRSSPGGEDRIVYIEQQSQRLHDEIAHGSFDRVSGSVTWCIRAQPTAS
ncbi:hypothetical protein [Lichenifustis flavocetrariae]|uniref:Uncharacterized protein n=1 Tax=Lichenifustis flavocetrariae TaxID=2949735 RepID=A0AA42CN77_9HYPH|nr:hypothetical protein [Lichenifustis flavocetrariae]MCW6512451.1 hypothetical protein [Lichenifustis flavocetrariae]